ncbi:hypothetical protein [Streptomyces violascens]|uniref:hypothetical protein n=1 Tax=Streptomyces violascens TaxID=67381 RepID=UPI0016795AE8|nr:hypothetical protein [Streptomyces violascens]
MTFLPARRAVLATAAIALGLLAAFPATATADGPGQDLVRQTLIGGVATEQPDELGIPVSTVSGVSSIAALHSSTAGSGPAGPRRG